LSTADENDTVATRDGARRALFGGVASIAVIYAIVSLIARIVIAVRADAVEFDGDWQ
jgi:hypothetical protein